MQLKMAGRKTISMELYNAIKSKDYCDFVNYLGPKDGLGIAAFLDSTCGQLYTADTSLLHRNGRRTNNNHIYQMFGEFSGMDSEEVKMAMLKEITNNYDFYERKCMAILHKLDMNLSHWLGRHLKKNVRADVLAIFVLSVMYDRHTVIHTNSMPWCTKKFHNRDGEANLFNSCHIHLLGVGDDMFIILRPKLLPSLLQSTSQSAIPGGSMEVFTSNTETHVEYTFELPKQPEYVGEKDCEVMDYYPPVPPNSEPNVYQPANSQELEVDVISSDSGPCERLSDGFEEYCELHMNPANTEQVNNTPVLDIGKNVTSSNATVPVNLPVDSDRTVSLNSSVRLSDLDQTPSERSFVDDNVELNMDVSDCNSNNKNNYVTSTNSMDIEYGPNNVTFLPDNVESDISSSDDEELFPSETSVSHTETDCSVNENIIRIRNDIVIEMTNRTCHLILPKLTDETVNYWKTRTTDENPSQTSLPINVSDNKTDPIKLDVPTGTLNITSCDYVDQKDSPKANPSLNTTASSGYNTPETNNDMSPVKASSGQNTPKFDDNQNAITQSSVKTSSGQNTSLTIDKDSVHMSASDGQNNTGNTSGSNDGSPSESLLQPVLTRSNRRASMKKYVNFKHMCNSNSSSDAEPAVKPLKPLPGHFPSSSRLRAQELINKHRIPKSECDSDGYSGDTEDCTDTENVNKHDKEHASNVSCSNMKLEPPDTNLDPSKPTISEESNKPKTKRKILTKTKTKGGQLDVEVKGILKSKKIRKSSCPKCKFSGFSTKELNEHYRKTHQPIPCTSCSKTFNNPSSHRRHRYTHTKSSNTFSCHRCSKTFPFESQLRSHKDIHRRLSTFACFAAGCKKVFRREATLIAHVQQHNGPLIKCDQCEYTCRDQRYLTQHYRTHTGAKPYDCKNCAKNFTFYEQWKRHKCAHSDEY